MKVARCVWRNTAPQESSPVKTEEEVSMIRHDQSHYGANIKQLGVPSNQPLQHLSPSKQTRHNSPLIIHIRLNFWRGGSGQFLPIIFEGWIIHFFTVTSPPSLSQNCVVIIVWNIWCSMYFLSCYTAENTSQLQDSRHIRWYLDSFAELSALFKSRILACANNNCLEDTLYFTPLILKLRCTTCRSVRGSGTSGTRVLRRRQWFD